MTFVSEAASNTRMGFSSAAATPLMKQAARSQAKRRATINPPTLCPGEYNAKQEAELPSGASVRRGWAASGHTRSAALQGPPGWRDWQGWPHRGWPHQGSSRQACWPRQRCLESDPSAYWAPQVLWATGAQRTLQASQVLRASGALQTTWA